MRLRLPVSCEWLLTCNCNMHCPFCSVTATSGKINSKYSDIEIEKIINNLKRTKCVYVALSGGEPLIHPQVLDIIPLLKREGFIVTLTSNGTLINEEVAKRLSVLGVFWVQMTLLSWRANEHNRIMGEGSFEKILNALKVLKKVGINTTICYTHKGDSYEDKKKVEDIAKMYGAQFINRTLMKVGKNSGICGLNGSLPSEICEVKNKNQFCIMPNGDIKTCSESKLVFGNIYKDDIMDIWKSNNGLGICFRAGELCLAEISCMDYEKAKMLLNMVKK